VNLAVFDIDGTLIRPNRVEDACFIEALEHCFGFSEVSADWTIYRNVTDHGIVSEVCWNRWGREATQGELDSFESHYSALLVDRLLPGDGAAIDGAAEFIADLAGDPAWRIAVATGNCHRLALHKLDRVGIEVAPFPMATSNDSHSRADLVRLAVSRASDRYGVPSFAHVVSVGDAPWDLKTARELEMPFVVVGSRCGSPPHGGAIVDYLDRARVMGTLAGAVCW
jgi:phosphoglycolate phosphatase-like HAD superfamily hydrolase